jgi:hypothetical protein
MMGQTPYSSNPSDVISPPDAEADFDLSTVSDKDLREYHQELSTAILNPGIEFESFDTSLGETYYRNRLKLVDAELKNRSDETSSGGGLP